MTKNRIYIIQPVFLLLLIMAGIGCRKTDYPVVDNPAYIRVFNSLTSQLTLADKDKPQPFLTMLIDPVLDKDGIPESAAVTGDFLDIRESWARPYPDAANTELYQKEYPGTAKVAAAPIINGYNLASWAQVVSGEHRIMFISRPVNTTPFFSLDKSLRKNTRVDTSINLTQGEVYTMQVLERDYFTNEAFLYVRNENFIKQPFSDSLVYVNFYNLSKKGYFENTPKMRQDGSGLRSDLITDTAAVYCTLKKVTTNSTTDIQGFLRVPMGSMIRSLEPAIAPYYHFPLFADTGTNRIYPGNAAQYFQFVKGGYVLVPGNDYASYFPDGYFLGLRVGPDGSAGSGLDHSVSVMADIRSGLIVTERSGIYNPRYFATVNSIEYINARVFITTIQRKLDPPVYR